MKKSIKIFLIILAVLLIFILVDTAQAKIFDNRPIIKITEDVLSKKLECFLITNFVSA